MVIVQKVTHSWTREGNPDALAISSPLQPHLLPQRQTLLPILLPLAVPCSTHDTKKSSALAGQQTLLVGLRRARLVRSSMYVKWSETSACASPTRKPCKGVEHQICRGRTYKHIHTQIDEHTQTLSFILTCTYTCTVAARLSRK